jgi:hypothetical protein
VGDKVNDYVFGGNGEVGCVLLAEDLMCVNNADKVTYCSLPLLVGDTAHRHKISPIRANASFVSHRYTLTEQQENFFKKHFALEEVDSEGDIVSLHNHLSSSYGLQNLGDMVDVHREIIKILFERNSLPEVLWLLDGDVPRQVQSSSVCKQDLDSCRLGAGDAYKLVFYMLSLLPDTVYMVRDGLPKHDNKFTGEDFDELLAATGLSTFPFCDLGPFGDDKEVLVYPSKEAVRELAIPAGWDGNFPVAAKRLMGDISERSMELYKEAKKMKQQMKQKDTPHAETIKSSA